MPKGTKKWHKRPAQDRLKWAEISVHMSEE